MPRKSKQAFTLIEMLVVITIIVILSMGITLIRVGGSGQKIYSAQRQLMVAFFEARNTAVSKQTTARVIIYRGDEDPTSKLRKFGVIYETDEGWVALNNGGVLPEGSFFIPPESDFAGHVDIAESASFSASDIFKSSFSNSKTGAESVVNISKFPSKEPQTINLGSGDWYSYTFTSDGLSSNPGAQVMVALGKVNNKDKLVLESPYEQLGFVVRRFGNTVPFTDYTEMEELMLR